MKTIINFGIVILFLYCSAVSAASHSGKIKSINLYGGEWGNSWKGGMLYRLDTMPAGITYFTVRANDIAFQNFLSMLLAAKHTKTPVVISYAPDKVNGNGYVNTLVVSEP